MGICKKIKKYIKRRLINVVCADVKPSLTASNQLCPIFNINQNLKSNQKRIAFVYIRSAWNTPLDIKNIYHPNLIHQVAMMNVLSKLGYCIDVYYCGSDKIGIPESMYANKYDIILGFGIQYIQLCQVNPNAIKILFITENAPWVVREKYDRRLTYFHERHPNIILQDSPRTDFYTNEMFEISDCGIAVTGSHNLSCIQERLPNVYRLDVNGLFNKSFNVSASKNHSITKSHFVWFGSRGFVHKGLDVLIDAFAELPQLSLDVYGIDQSEYTGIEMSENVSICGCVNVMDDEFINSVVNKNTFVVSLSCSEGMQTGITTCMMHGLIPIVTKECGVDDHDDILYFDNFDLESVKATLLSASMISTEQIREKEIRIHKKSIVDFSIESFAANFEKCFIQSHQL